MEQPLDPAPQAPTPSDRTLAAVAMQSLLLQLDERAEPADPDDLPSLRAQLRAAVYYLLTRDFERLIRISYHMDIAEAEFAAAIGGNNMETVAEHLADAMVHREQQRLRSRR